MSNKRIIDLPTLSAGIPFDSVFLQIDSDNGTYKVALDEFAIPLLSEAIDGSTLVYNAVTSTFEWGAPVTAVDGINTEFMINGGGALSASSILTYNKETGMVSGINEMNAPNDNFWMGPVWYSEYDNSSQKIFVFRLSSGQTSFARSNFYGATVLGLICADSSHGIELTNSEDIFNATKFASFSKKGNIENIFTHYKQGVSFPGKTLISYDINGIRRFDNDTDGIINSSVSAAIKYPIVKINKREQHLCSTDFSVNYTVDINLSASDNFNITRNKNGVVTFTGNIIGTDINPVLNTGQTFVSIDDTDAMPNQDIFIVAPMAHTGYAYANKPKLFLFIGIRPTGEVYNPTTYSVSRVWLDNIKFQTDVEKLG